MTDIFVTSLGNRVRAMNTLWERAASDMTLEQVNHHERSGVLPIAFSFSHFIRLQDQSVSGLIRREETIWDEGGWAGKIGVKVDRLGREETVEEMERQRFKDFDAWKQYQAQVIARRIDFKGRTQRLDCREATVHGFQSVGASDEFFEQLLASLFQGAGPLLGCRCLTTSLVDQTIPPFGGLGGDLLSIHAGPTNQILGLATGRRREAVGFPFGFAHCGEQLALRLLSQPLYLRHRLGKQL